MPVRCPRCAIFSSVPPQVCSTSSRWAAIARMSRGVEDMCVEITFSRLASTSSAPPNTAPTPSASPPVDQKLPTPRTPCSPANPPCVWTLLPRTEPGKLPSAPPYLYQRSCQAARRFESRRARRPQSGRPDQSTAQRLVAFELRCPLLRHKAHHL